MDFEETGLKSLEVKSKMRGGENAPSLQVNPFKFRPTILADSIVKRVQKAKGFKTYAFTVSWIVEQYAVVEAWREARLNEVRESLFKYKLRKEEL